jgi:hypothetical protein
MKLNPILARAAGVASGWLWSLLQIPLSCAGLCFGCALLVVVIAGPNIQKYMTSGHGFPAKSEIDGIDLALTKILSDAGCSSLSDILDSAAFGKVCAWYELQYNTDEFEAQAAVSTRAAHALIVSGRGALLPQAGDDVIMAKVRKVYAVERVSNLGTSYYSELGNDPWGNPYQIFAGPWKKAMGPVLFRNYAGPTGQPLPGDPPPPPESDALTVIGGGDVPETHGFPASTKMEFYIWSLGANGVSDQPRYDPTHTYAPPARQYYRSDAPDEYLGGGDDINNWDRNQTFMSFYN